MLDEIRAAFRTENFYQASCSLQARAVLDEIIQHPAFPGATDPSVLTLLGTFLQIIHPKRVLQLGTFVGFSAILIADILANSTRSGHLVTVEPDPVAHDMARNWVRKAGLHDAVTFLDGYSTAPEIQKALQANGPYQLIYLDSSHAYQATLDELDFIFETGKLLAPGGLLLLHDVGELATQWDATGAGGVRRAVAEWMATRRDRYQDFIFEPPFWPNVCGLGLITERASVAQRDGGSNHPTSANQANRSAKTFLSRVISYVRDID